MSFIQELNTTLNNFEKSFQKEMLDMFIKSNFKQRFITEFNKADLNIKLKTDVPTECTIGLDNYKTGDYLTLSFYNSTISIVLKPVYVIETNNIHYLTYHISAGVTRSDSSPQPNSEYKNYLINDAGNYEYGLLTVKNNDEYKKLIETFYNSLHRVLGGYDKLHKKHKI